MAAATPLCGGDTVLLVALHGSGSAVGWRRRCIVGDAAGWRHCVEDILFLFVKLQKKKTRVHPS
jgi:hypothetical protein